jgi:hypothetical protein
VEFLKLSQRVERTEERIPDFIARFIADAGTYRNFDEQSADSRERLFFDRREVLDAGIVYPITLRLWRSEDQGIIDHERLVTALRAMESYLTRRMVMRMTTKPYNRLVVDLLGRMAADTDPVRALVDYLGSFSPDSQRWWPDDAAFRQHLVTQPLYGAVTQARVRMLLEAAEARMRTAKTEHVHMKQKLTIEHVIPQTWETTWPLPDDAGDEAYARRGSHLHRLGNLTLVTGALNPAMGNDPWADKREALDDHTVLRLNANLINGNPNCFDEDCIDARGAALAALLLAEWPGPDSTEWKVTSG